MCFIYSLADNALFQQQQQQNQNKKKPSGNTLNKLVLMVFQSFFRNWALKPLGPGDLRFSKAEMAPKLIGLS